VIFVVGILLALFVFPDGWEIPVIIGFGVLEIVETSLTWRLSQMWRPRVGPETLIGAVGRAVTDCRPRGTVRVNGEEWRARSETGAAAGEPVRVVARERLTLVVEPIPEDRERR
jgi:membrane-bound serine protease (ClpP class)